MTHIYTNLGAVPQLATRQAERSDLLLRWTGDAARKLMRLVRRYPADQQATRLDQMLAQFDAGLPGKVRQVATRLRADGMGTNLAVERALALSLADSMITRIKNVGMAAQGRPVPLSGLGQTSPSTSPDAGQILAQTLQGVVCSQGLQTAITDLVGRNEGRDAASATAVGFGVGSGVAQCGSLTTPPPPPADPSGDEEGSLAVPIVVGVGVIAAIGGILWWTTRKK